MYKTNGVKITKLINTNTGTVASHSSNTLKTSKLATKKSSIKVKENQPPQKFSISDIELLIANKKVPNFMSFCIKFSSFKNKSHSLLLKYLRYTEIIELIPKIKNRKLFRALIRSNFEYDNQDFKSYLVKFKKEDIELSEKVWYESSSYYEWYLGILYKSQDVRIKVINRGC